MEIKEGYINFKNHKTYYRLVGEAKNGKKPLILLHGGPGSTHNYFEVIDSLAKRDERMIVMYDLPTIRVITDRRIIPAIPL